jgi:Fur family ferric uptake transcriptional regulator
MGSAVGREEREALSTYLAKHHLKRSDQREVILDAFLKAEKHLSVDDLLALVQKRRPDIGRTTVYRTLKLFQEAGLASELAVDGQQMRFEVDFKREHHDHFICKSCGDIFEFSSPEIERLQEVAARQIGFVTEGHRHQIFGLCSRCAARRKDAGR